MPSLEGKPGIRMKYKINKLKLASTERNKSSLEAPPPPRLLQGLGLTLAIPGKGAPGFSKLSQPSPRMKPSTVDISGWVKKEDSIGDDMRVV